ncbi:MAG: peptidase M15 [Saprospirales bacterium]|nr:MAG: peptidase M15 [Saprospirales bacterium]
MRLIKFFTLLICFSVFACTGSKNTDDRIIIEETQEDSRITTEEAIEVHKEETQRELLSSADYDTTLWTDINRIQPDILLDLRYATTNNFLEKQLYECARCFLRPETAKALQKVHLELRTKGYGLLVWDCYRPQSVQRKMWAVMPNPNYVANPERGSMHSRGVAVDATIVDEAGIPLNMGTDFDYFGRAAHYDNRDLPEEVLQNRDLLRATMEKYGLMGIRTEWWHFSMRDLGYPLDEMVWGC